MTADYCAAHRCHTCRCPKRAYSDPWTGAVVRLISAADRLPVPGKA